MDPDSIFWMVVILVSLLIPFVAIMRRPLMRWMDLQERKHELAARVADGTAADHAAKIERLEAHVAVLNRIATDRATNLAHDIDTLRGPPAPLR